VLSGRPFFRYDDRLHSYRCAGFSAVRQQLLQPALECQTPWAISCKTLQH